MYWCVIPAAGSGSRVGGRVPKQYKPLLGKPMLLRTMERVASHPRIAGLVVVLASDDPYWPGLVMCAGKPVRTCVGGADRADSVFAGLDCLGPSVDARSWILVHDAARPCVSHEDMTALIEAGTRHPVGALIGAPVRDTLKQSDGEKTVACAVPRENIWRAFTPQVFRHGELMEALCVARKSPAHRPLLTDDASALELQGKTPLLVEGSDDNLKVTTPGDFARAERILRSQGVVP